MFRSVPDQGGSTVRDLSVSKCLSRRGGRDGSSKKAETLALILAEANPQGTFGSMVFSVRDLRSRRLWLTDRFCYSQEVYR